MKDYELLNAMSDMMDEKLEPLKTGVANLESSVANLESDMSEVKMRVTNLESDMSEVKMRVTNLESGVANLESDMSEVKMRVTKLETANEMIIIPGINELCSAYKSEFGKYQISVRDHDRLVTDVDALKAVVPHHSEQIAELQCVCGL